MLLCETEACTKGCCAAEEEGCAEGVVEEARCEAESHCRVGRARVLGDVRRRWEGRKEMCGLCRREKTRATVRQFNVSSCIHLPRSFLMGWMVWRAGRRSSGQRMTHVVTSFQLQHGSLCDCDCDQTKARAAPRHLPVRLYHRKLVETAERLQRWVSFDSMLQV